MAQEIISEIHIWSRIRWCHMSNSPGHLQHIQERSGEIVCDVCIWSGAKLC